MNWKLYIEMVRPKTLFLSFGIIFVGNVLAFWFGKFSFLIFILTLFSMTCFQILSNLANDYGDFTKGSDQKDRIGPRRLVSDGIISQNALKFAIFLSAFLAIFSAILIFILTEFTLREFLYLCALAVICAIAAITYTVGKYAYGYYGLGDFFVFIFFGIVAVCGSFFVQTHEILKVIILPAFSCGLLSMAVLNINNMRDFNSDLLHKKHTIVVKFGLKFAKFYHAFLIIFAFIFYAVFCILDENIFAFLMILPLIFCLKHIKKVFEISNLKEFFPLLGELSKLTFFVNLTFCFAVILNKL